MTRRQKSEAVEGLVVDLEAARLCWAWRGVRVDVSVPELDSVLVDAKGRNVFALAGRLCGHPAHLIGFAGDGAKLFEVGPPQSYLFSYLTHHPFAPIAVVAGGETAVDNFRDWHFAINPTGVLTRISPAY